MSLTFLSKKRTTKVLINNEPIEAQRIDITNIKLPRKFKSVSALIFENELHILGDIYHYKFDGDKWIEVSTIPYPIKYDTACIWFTDQIYILVDDINYRNTYVWDGTEWVRKDSTLVDACHVIYCHLNGSGNLYAVGKNNSSTNFNFYKNTGNWGNLTNIPYDFRDGVAITYKGEIHVIGSSIESNSKKHYKWNGSSWSNVSTLPISIHYGKAVVYDDKIYAFNEDGECLIWNGTSWSVGTPLEYGMKYGSVVVYNNKIYYLGGINNPEAFLEYDAQNKIYGLSK